MRSRRSAISLALTAVAVLAALVPAAHAGGGGGIGCMFTDTNGNGFVDLDICSVPIDANGDGMRVRNATSRTITSVTLTLPGDKVFNPSALIGGGLVGPFPFSVPFFPVAASFTASTSAADKKLTLLFSGPDPFGPGEAFDFTFDVDVEGNPAANVPGSALSGLLFEARLDDGSSFSLLFDAGGAPFLPTSLVSSSFFDSIVGNPDVITRTRQIGGVLIVTVVPGPAAFVLVAAGLAAGLGLRRLRRRGGR
jgi:hypothetical protein